MYKVSVVTPFHNVDMDMFQKCADGMRCQTIGFENIEWIIVAHNCQPHYFPQLTEMFKDDKNVIVKELNNDMHSPASPRNHGMQLVTGPYLGFLDADDSYTPECLEVASREMAETQSQVVTFRREYELEKESLHPHTEKVAWNQTEWRIVMDRKDFQLDKMFTGLWPFSTSRLFDVAFLRKHNLMFSKDVLWVEDVWHTGMCLMLADRVCYLPQFIGYHYFINSGSIIQNKKKSMEELYECFRSANIIIDDLEKMGVDTNDTANTLFSLLTQYYLGSDLTVEQRRTLCDMARPYLKRLRKMPPSKIHTPEECYLSYSLSKEVLGNPENPIASPTLKDEQNGWSDMMEILRNNSSTDYGLRYHFDQVETLADYQRLVPMSDYEDYKRLLDLQANIGESGILTTVPTRQYLINAKGQLVPCTDHHLLPYMESFATTLKHHHNLLVAIVGPRKKQTNDGCTVESAFHSGQPLAKALWSKLERVVAFGAGECYDATVRMKQYTGQIPHNNGYYYTEETIYGRAMADDSDLFESLPSNCFHEYLPLKEDNATTVFSTDTKTGIPYQLVVTNSAGLYRYVTDHIVCIQETQMDRILFTIY